LAKRARSAVVSIEVFDDEGNLAGTGSGFFVSSDGLLVTNYHVIKGASTAVAKTASGERLSIKGAVYFDRDNDLAVLLPEGKTFPFLPLGSSSEIEVGDDVAVIGNPLGLEGSLSEGIISGKRDLTAQQQQHASPTPVPGAYNQHYPPPRNFNLPFDKPNWLQITAPISPGSSGSPVLDATGNVIGIATMLLREGQSLNFALPAEVVIAMLETHKQQARKQRPLVTFKELLWQEDQIQNILEVVFNNSPEWEKAYEAYKNARHVQIGRDAEIAVYRDTFGMAPVKTEPVDWASVLELAKVLLDKYPDRVHGWELLGNVYVGMNLPGDAILAYKQATALAKQQNDVAPTIPGIWGELGSTYEKMQQTTEARYAFSQAVVLQKKIVAAVSRPENYAIGPDPEATRKAIAEAKGRELTTLGDYYVSAGDSDGAKQSYLEASSAYADAGKREASDRCLREAKSLGWR
jgi:tetratricopeptide (TPR) repeat protein